MANYVYSGFGLKPETIINKANAKELKDVNEDEINLKNNVDNSNCFVIYREDVKEKKPKKFFVGGMPMYMEKSSKIINGTKYTVYTSGAIYPMGVNMKINTINK